MTKHDWLFQSGDQICNFRTAGVLIRNDKILVQREKSGNEYALPGGHVAIGETSAESLIREWKEETGAGITCRRLLWTQECFWNWGNCAANTLTFYYSISLTNEASIPDRGKAVPQKDNSDVVLEWLPLDMLHRITIFPAFLKKEVYHLEEPCKHFITKE